LSDATDAVDRATCGGADDGPAELRCDDHVGSDADADVHHRAAPDDADDDATSHAASDAARRSCDDADDDASGPGSCGPCGADDAARRAWRHDVGSCDHVYGHAACDGADAYAAAGADA